MRGTEPIRALVVHDGESFAERAAETLAEERDIETTFLTGAGEALDWLEGNPVDCIVCDAETSDGDGLAFFDRVRDRDDDVPFILLTGRGDAEAASRAIAAGVDDYLVVLGADGDVRYDRLANRIESVVARQQTQRLYERQNERLENFASVVSHDLRNPLNVAQSSVELVRDQVDDEHVDRLDRSLTRMSDIIDDVLTLAREGDAVEEPSPVDLETMARDAWSTVQTGEMDLVVEAEGRIAADADRLKELLGNLFHNATEHADAATVRVGEMSERGDFYVADDGEGIPEDQREAVFETGFSTARTGTGLGLSIVEEIATAHGWSVSATESAEGGARFEITGVEAR